jgi:pimeloyl-ACP methyl ester carboxylesterase
MSGVTYALLILFLHLPASADMTDPGNEPVIYLLPGTGADCRLFNKIDFPYDTVHLEFPMPERKMSLRDYACSFIPRIDTNRKYILVGVSLGGMISTELADTLSPERVIIISSAKCRDELPGRYKFQKYVPINQIAPKKLIKWGSKVLAPKVEPERKQDTIFRSMLMAKDPAYLKWTVNMIIDWKRKEYDSRIVHIHGDNDSTLPIRNISYDYLLPEGSHMMVYIRAEEVSGLINKILAE